MIKIKKRKIEMKLGDVKQISAEIIWKDSVDTALDIRTLESYKTKMKHNS